MTEPIVRVTVIDSLVERLEAAVLEGEFPVGSQLPGETVLAGQYQVSRPIVREALARLRERGYVETINGRGTFVTQPGIDAVAQAVMRRIRDRNAGSYTVDHLYEVRRTVELDAAELAAHRADTKDLEEIQLLLERMRDAEDAEAYTAADIDFHVRIAEATGNSLFPIIVGPIIDLVVRGMFASVISNEDAMTSGIAEHARILERLRAGDAGGARAAMAEHLAHSRATHPGVV